MQVDVRIEARGSHLDLRNGFPRGSAKLPKTRGSYAGQTELDVRARARPIRTSLSRAPNSVSEQRTQKRDNCPTARVGRDSVRVLSSGQ